jgi:hypothetical protein
MALSSTLDPSKVKLEWVLRKSVDYFVDPSQVIGAPFIFAVGNGAAIARVNQGVGAMSVGGAPKVATIPNSSRAAEATYSRRLRILLLVLHLSLAT